MTEPRLHLVAVGPQKTATTWLDACLRSHPRLCLPSRTKETFFLDEEFARGWEWYWRHFEGCAADHLRGEAGPSYFEVPAVPERLRAHNPDCRIIVTLRDPAARSFSLYLHHRKKGRVGGAFEDAVREQPRILDGSRYSAHLPRWLDAFGRDRVLVILQEEVAQRPEALLEEMWRFLGLDSPGVPASARETIYAATSPRWPALARLVTRGGRLARRWQLFGLIEGVRRLGVQAVFTGGSEVERLPAELRASLVASFAPDIAFVETLLGRPLPGWRSV